MANEAVPAPRAQLAFTRTCGGLAALIPLWAALGNLARGPLWHTDRALVQGLGFLPDLSGGGVSVAAAQLALWCPWGNVYQRAAAVAALGLAAFGLVTYRAGLRWLQTTTHREDPWLPLFALLAALLATLTPEALSEATVSSWAPVSAALCLPLVFRGTNSSRSRLTSHALTGLLAGALLVQAPALLLWAAGLASLRALCLLELPGPRALLQVLGWTLLTSLPLAGPLVLRAYTLGSWHALPSPFPRLQEAELLGGPPANFGILAFGLAGFALVRGLPRLSQRPWLLSGVLLLATWGLTQWQGLRVPWPEFMRCVELLAGAVLALVAVAGALFCFHQLRQRLLSARRWVTALVPATAVTCVLVNYEDARRELAPREHASVAAWTAEALGELPTDATVLLSSTHLLERLWAAQLAEGSRPDLLIVPLERLTAARLIAELLEREPALGAVLRDHALHGAPSERSLVQLADARPVFIEPDAGWGSRLLDHVLPRGHWLEFSAFPVGHTDRKLAFAAGLGPVQRSLARAASLNAPDPATLRVLRAQVRQQLLVLGAVRDRRQLRTAVDALFPVDAQHPLLAQLHSQFAADTGEASAAIERVLGLANPNE